MFTPRGKMEFGFARCWRDLMSAFATESAVSSDRLKDQQYVFTLVATTRKHACCVAAP